MSRLLRYAAVAAGALVVSLTAEASGRSQPATASQGAISFSGRAYVVGGKMGPQGQAQPATIEGIQVGPLVDTGPLAASGGELDACAISYPDDENCMITPPIGDPLNGALQADVLHATTIGHGNHSTTEVSVAELSLELPGAAPLTPITISASFVRAEAEAKCNDGRASLTASSEIADLFIDPDGPGGIAPVAVDVSIPSQTVTVGSLTVDVVVNDQVKVLSASGDAGDVTVNALQITLTNPVTGNETDVVLAAAHADVVCPTPRPPCNGPEKVTGGGWVPKGASRANFAVAGRQLSAWGHFLYVDHGTGQKLKAVSVDPMTFDANGFAVLTGVAQLNGSGAYPYTVKVKDNGEPGRADQFMLTSVISQPLTTLSGGNIQFHKPCKP